MSPYMKNDRILLVHILVITFFSVGALYAVQGSKGFSLWDEGFLWYGVQRVLAGEVPIRDFMSYDPGRYYFSAALMRLSGVHGIMGLRATLAIIQAIGLCVGLWLVARAANSRAKDRLLFLLLVASIFLAWMLPRHKMYDVSISIFLLGILSFLARKPLPQNYFLAGLGIGLAAVFGRNHGVYGLVGSLGLIGWLNLNRIIKRCFLKDFSLWACGVTIGFFPVVLMAVFVPRFGSAYVESIRWLFEQGGATNLPLPIPWPWRAEDLRGVLVGFLFIGLPLFASFGIATVVRRQLQGATVEPTLAASAFLAVPYAYEAFSRADVYHLAQGIFPLLVGLLVILQKMDARFKWPLALAFCAASVWIVLPYQRGWQCRGHGRCVSVVISGDKLMVDPTTAADVAMLRGLADKYAPQGRAVLVEPFWPGAYALLRRRSPMWENYALFHRSDAFQNREIARIKAASPGFVLILDLALNGEDQLRFKNTHSLIYGFIQSHFQRVRAFTGPSPGLELYIAKNGGQ